MNPGGAWWLAPQALDRFVGDLLAAEIARLRPGRAAPRLPWPGTLQLDETGLGADSLERLQLGTALAEAIGLNRSGIEDSLLAGTTIGDWIQTAALGLAGFSAELTFRTSGSTGQPKWCVHRLADLEAEIDVVAGISGGYRRIIALVPSHHIYGFLFTILLAARLTAEVIDVRNSSPARLGTLLRAGDLIVGHPDFWRAFIRVVPQVGPGIAGVSSTGPCPAEVALAVRATGIEALTEIYGSSETAGIGWRTDPDAAYELFPYWQRGGDETELRRRSSDGTLRTMSVPDRLLWADERHVRPAGRREGAVQVGGHNVFPERVRAVLCAHPGVARAAVRLMQPHEGERLKAFVVPRDGRTDRAELRAALWNWIDARLSAPERPKSIEIGSALPQSGLGKSADWPISTGVSKPGEPNSTK